MTKRLAAFTTLLTIIAAVLLLSLPQRSHAITVPTLTPTPPSPATTPTPTAVPRPNQRDSLREQIQRGERLFTSPHFVFYDNGGSLPTDIERFAADAEQAYDYVQAQMQVDIDIQMMVGFRPAMRGTCPARGYASEGAFMFLSDDTFDDTMLLGILAHEVGHVLHLADGDPVMPRNNALSEGFATWVAREYQLAWYGDPSLDAMVRGYVDTGAYLPLTDTWQLPGIYPGQGNDAEGCLQRRDQLYTQWASFVGYLIDTYGQETLYTLFERDSRDTAQQAPPDYEAVYGQSLDQLEAAWLQTLRADGD